MIVSQPLYHVMLYASLVIAVLALVGVIARQRALLVVVVVGGATAYALHRGSTDVVVVRDGGDGPTAQRMEYVWRGVEDVPLAPGSTGEGLLPPTWVVNESTATVRIETVEYGDRVVGRRRVPTIEVPPGTRASKSGIDLLGPEDEPPDEVSNDVGLKHDALYWLTW